MTCHDDIITRWADRVLGRTDKPNYSRSNNVYAVDTSDRTDTLYSYGSHFPMAQPLRDADGSLRVVLVNGDNFSVTTARHQRLTRDVIRRAGMPSIIVPFSALDGASIARSTVRPLEVTEDRTIYTDHATTTRVDGTHWRQVSIWATRQRTDEELAEKCEERDRWRRDDHERHTRYYASGHLPNDPGPFEPTTPDQLHAHERTIYAPHHLAWQLCERAPQRSLGAGTRWSGNNDGWAQWQPQWTMPDISAAWSADDKPAKDWPSFLAWAIGASLIHAMTGQPTRAWRWRTGRHQLGESLFTADVTWHEWRRCLAHAERDAHGHCRKCYSSNDEPGRYQIRRTRKAVKFLSGFDNQEPRPLYFLCEMPSDSVATTVADAYEELKPSTVKLGERLELPVTRQGDIFAVMVPDVDKRGLRKLGATFELMRERESVVAWNEETGRVDLIRPANRDACLLLGTNHMATEVARMPNGTTLARGVLRHVPSGRPADHRRQKMADGKSWHIIVKNTVPIR